MSLIRDLKRSIRAERRSIKRALPAAPLDTLSMRPSFYEQMLPVLPGHLEATLRGDKRAAKLTVALRKITLQKAPFTPKPRWL